MWSRYKKYFILDASGCKTLIMILCIQLSIIGRCDFKFCVNLLLPVFLTSPYSIRPHITLCQSMYDG